MHSDQSFTFTLPLTVEGPTGLRVIASMDDLGRLCQDFNDELNTALTQRENLLEQLHNAHSLLTAQERELIHKQSFEEGYNAAMLEKSAWDLS